MKNNIKKFPAIFIILISAFGFLSCVSTSSEEKDARKESEQIRKTIAARYPYSEDAYRKAILSGDYETARYMLEGLKSLDYAQLIDLGMLQYYDGAFDEAAATLDAATNVIGEEFVKRLRGDGAKKSSFATNYVNDALLAYQGTIYEFLLVDAFNALNFYQEAFKKGFQYDEDDDDLLERAYNHIVRVSERRDQYGQMFDYLLESGSKEKKSFQGLGLSKFESVLSDAGYDYYGSMEKVDRVLTTSGISTRILERAFPEKSKNEDIYRVSALADFLHIVLASQYSETMEDDLAMIIDELNMLAPNVEMDFYKSHSSNGRIEVIALVGAIAQRVEHLETIPTTINVEGERMPAKFAWPEYSEDFANIRVPEDIKVILNDGTSKDAVVLEDFDMAVKADVNLNARRAAARSVCRVVSYQLSPAQTANADNKKKREEGRDNITTVDSLYRDGVLGVKADLRQAMAFPSKAYCAGFDVAPGKYTVTIVIDGVADAPIEVEVKAGKPVLVESICK